MTTITAVGQICDECSREQHPREFRRAPGQAPSRWCRACRTPEPVEVLATDRLLPAAPFAAWVRKYVERYDTYSGFSEIIGCSDRLLRDLISARRATVTIERVDFATGVVGDESLSWLYPVVS